MAERILFVFEGAKTEPNVFENLKNHFFPAEENEFVTATYNTDVYALWREIKKTYGDDEIKLFQILKEKRWNESDLSGLEERDFSQVFLFFDHDGHAPRASDKDLAEMMHFFCDETENGKLYISYPMVEAIRHVTTDFQNLTVSPKPKSEYLKDLKKTSKEKFSKGTPDLSIWKQVIDLNFKKAHFIVTQTQSKPERHDQIEIFNGQLTHYITLKCKVAVLSAFPLFIKDYFRPKILEDILE